MQNEVQIRFTKSNKNISHHYFAFLDSIDESYIFVSIYHKIHSKVNFLLYSYDSYGENSFFFLDVFDLCLLYCTLEVIVYMY